MISVEEALTHVMNNTVDFGTEEVDLVHAVGRVLAEDITADRDMPPFDRVTMDGIAVKANAFVSGVRRFHVENIQTAGNPPKILIDDAGCIEVMTGSVLPLETDAVIPYELLELSEGHAVVKTDSLVPGQNIHKRGTDAVAEKVLLKKGIRINAAAIGLMATVGAARVEVKRLPRVAICSTGNELVDVQQLPEGHQIRMSNSVSLAADLIKDGFTVALDHLIDEKETMLQQVGQLLSTYDVIIFSGAVSKGKLDLLPDVLAESGVEVIFHNVAQRPGKPFLFGRKNNVVVFGFPGNPVSTLVCYNYYFKRWLSESVGMQKSEQYPTLAADVIFKPNLTYHLPVSLENKDGRLLATPVQFSNSGDVVTITKADGFVTLPSQRQEFAKGEVFPFTPL